MRWYHMQIKKLRFLDEFFMSFDIDRKRTGPRILPFGTPHVIGFSSENTLHILSFCVLLLK